MKKVLYVTSVCCLSLLILFTLKTNLSGNNTSSREFIPTAQLLLKIKEENKVEKVAYLTFDDGPSEITPLILDTLKEKDVKATFFLSGKEITPEREGIVNRTVQEGHAIGVHTFSHKKNDLYNSYNVFFQDLEAAQRRIKEVIGTEAVLHRYPWGSANNYLAPIFREVTAELQARGIWSYDWHASGDDSFNNGVQGEQIKKNVERHYARYNDPIILLHDSNVAKNTALILEKMIDMMRENGYQFDTLEHREPYLFPEEWRK